jgi:hypothetical protein
MDPHEDLVAQQRAPIDAHRDEVARLASDTPDAVKVDVFPEDQAVLDAKKAVEDAQAAMVAAQQVAYVAKVKRAAEAAAQATADATKETADGKPSLTPAPVQQRPVPQQ